MTTVQSKIKQWNECDLLKCFEYKLLYNDSLTVFVYLHTPGGRAKKGLCFGFYGRGLKTWFSGDVKKRGGLHFIAFEDHLSLDEELQRIDDEITEGFLLPNELFVSEEE